MKVDGQCVISPLDKAEALNNQFFTFFTDENTLSPNLEPSFPLIGDLSFTAKGIENILNNLSTDKSPGPDNIPNFILKLSSSIIAPFLQNFLLKVLMIKNFLMIGCLLTSYQFTRKATKT